MRGLETDFFGRLQSFLDVFGGAGLLVVIIVSVVFVGLAIWRGVGLLLFILFLSYSVGAITWGGVTFAATLVRWACLILLGVSFFRRFRFPRASFLPILCYVILGFVFAFSSPFYRWSFQQVCLLFATVVFVYISTVGYLSFPEKIEQLFKMGIIAASVWTVTCMLFVKGYIYSSSVRFSTDEAVSGGTVARAGVYFAPMLIWGIVQNRLKLWRIYSLIFIVPFIFILLLGAVRSAIFGMLIIASMPLILFKLKPLKFILLIFSFIAISAASLFILSIVVPDRADILYERLFSASTSGRVYVWKDALHYFAVHPFLGRGIGVSSLEAQLEFGMLFHNGYFQVWYDTGLLGLLSLLIFLLIYTFRSFRLTLQIQSEWVSMYARVALGYMLGIMASALVEATFATAGGIGTSMLIITAALIDGLDRISKQQLYDDLYLQETLTFYDEDFYEENALAQPNLY